MRHLVSTVSDTGTSLVMWSPSITLFLGMLMMLHLNFLFTCLPYQTINSMRMGIMFFGLTSVFSVPSIKTYIEMPSICCVFVD